MEDFYYEESNAKHVFIKCMLFLFIIGLISGGFIFYKKQNTIKLKNVNVELGSELSNNVDDYLVNGKKYSSNYKLYLDKVDVNTIGKYSYKVKYNKHTKTGYINVQDTTKPEVTLDDLVTIGKDEDNIPVEKLEMKKEDAIAMGAEAMFIEKYGDIVSVYKIGDVSLELCGGPHVSNTSELGKFKIKKEEASSAGVRRIKAILI